MLLGTGVLLLRHDPEVQLPDLMLAEADALVREDVGCGAHGQPDRRVGFPMPGRPRKITFSLLAKVQCGEVGDQVAFQAAGRGGVNSSMLLQAGKRAAPGQGGDQLHLPGPPTTHRGLPVPHQHPRHRPKRELPMPIQLVDAAVCPMCAPQHHDQDQDEHDAPRVAFNARTPSPGATFATRRSEVRVP
jgi:hypothetical protein